MFQQGSDTENVETIQSSYYMGTTCKILTRQSHSEINIKVSQMKVSIRLALFGRHDQECQTTLEA